MASIPAEHLIHVHDGVIVRPGDKLVIHMQGRLDMARAELIKQQVADALPGVEAVLIDNSLQVLVYRPGEVRKVAYSVTVEWIDGTVRDCRSVTWEVQDGLLWLRDATGAACIPLSNVRIWNVTEPSKEHVIDGPRQDAGQRGYAASCSCGWTADGDKVALDMVIADHEAGRT